MALILAAQMFDVAPLVGATNLGGELLPSQWEQIHPEPREKAFFALAAIFGVLGALAGAFTRAAGNPHIGWSSGVFFLAAVPAINAVSAIALSTEEVSLVVFAYSTLLLAVGVLVFRRISRSTDQIRSLQIVDNPVGRNDAGPATAVAIILATVLFPASIGAVAAKIGYEMHVVSFIIGPALYSVREGLVPGLDYFTQYSVGLPYLFHFLLAPSADATVTRYAWLMIFSMYAYYLGAACFLRWLFGSWRWAVSITGTVLILQFHTDRPFFDPSSFVLRHPLLIVDLALFAWWVKTKFDWGIGLVLSISVAGSLFLNTETGMYQWLCFSFLSMAMNRSWARGLRNAVGFSTLAIAIFTTLCLIAFGPRVLSLEFLLRLLEPFFIYGGGFGGWTVDWRWGWHLIYNVIAPGVALATIGWGIFTVRDASDETVPYIAAIVAVAFLAISISAKYWNMSIVALWHVNSFGFVVVLAWWARILCRSIALVSFVAPHKAVQLGRASAIVFLGLAVVLVVTADDPRNPTEYGVRAYAKYPSLFLAPFRRKSDGCAQLSCAAPRLADKDISLIRKYVPENGRAAILDWNDWAYLIEAKRKPKFMFLPSPATFTRRQMTAATKDLDLLFLPKDAEGKPVVPHPELKVALAAEIASEFEIVGIGENLLVLRRKKRRP